MSDVVGAIETKSAFYATYKTTTGDTAETLNEWVMNVVSATRDDAPAHGNMSLRDIHGTECLVLDSYTVIGNGTKASVHDMVRTGPSDAPKGIHNQKGIGSRLIMARLGGVESDACEMMAITVDANARRGAIVRLGPKADGMYGDGSIMIFAAADLVFDECTKKCSSFAFDPADAAQSALAQHILHFSGHPFQIEENMGETRRNLLHAANECMYRAMADTSQVFTRFFYFNLGSADTQPREPLLEVVDGRLVCNDSQLALAEFFREYYLPPSLGIYPLPELDGADATRGHKDFAVQGETVFDVPSFLHETHHDPGTIKSDVLRIDCGNGACAHMLAYWPTPDVDGHGLGTCGSARYHMHTTVAFCTGTYFAYHDKIINAYDPKTLNKQYPGADGFEKSITYARASSNTKVKCGFFNVAPKHTSGLEHTYLREWLGLRAWSEWEAVGLPSPASIKASKEFDVERIYEMLTCGAIFVVRIDQVAALNTQKNGLVAKEGLGLSVPELVYRIRRAQVVWCLQNKPQERLKKEAAAAARAAAAPPRVQKPVTLQAHHQRCTTSRTRRATESYRPLDTHNSKRRRVQDKRARMYDLVVEMAKTPSEVLGLASLRAERDKLLQLVATGAPRTPSPAVLEDLDGEDFGEVD